MGDLNEFQRRIGVGERSSAFLRVRGGARVTPVVREEGRHRGTVGGARTEHWDGRVDMEVRPAPVQLTVSKSEGRVVDVAV